MAFVGYLGGVLGTLSSGIWRFVEAKLPLLLPLERFPSCDNVAVGCDHVISIDIPQMQFSTGALPIGTNMLIFKQVRLRIKSVDGRGVRLQMRVL